MPRAWMTDFALRSRISLQTTISVQSLWKKKRNSMKRNTTKDQKRKSRRLRLNRETIQVLNDPAFLEQVRGAGACSELERSCAQTTTSISSDTSC